MEDKDARPTDKGVPTDKGAPTRDIDAGVQPESVIRVPPQKPQPQEDTSKK